MNTDQETIPKRVFGESDEAVSGDQEHPPVPPPALDHLIPTGATSAEKKQLFADSTCLFSGHYDAASICGMLASLDEPDLRELRDQLHSALTAAVPAVAGRPLSRRNAGNLHGLAEDCWALGSSAAQGVLTHRAESATLRPAGRTPLASPAPAPTAEQSGIASSLQEVFSTQLRLEKEVSEMRARLAAQESRSQRVLTLEEENTQLREICAAHESRIEQLERQVVGMSDNQQQGSRPPASSVLHLAGNGVTTDSGGATAASGAPAPVPTDRTAAAREVAAALDLRALGEAIASALQWRAGDSDSEPDLDKEPVNRAGPDAGIRQDRTQTARDVGTSGAAAPVSQTQKQNQVIGSGPSSDIVRDPETPPEPRRVFFILEGVRLGAADRDVRNMVWGIVHNLHDFQRLPHRGLAAPSSKAYRIEIDESDAVPVMDPASWPAGLLVRRCSGAGWGGGGGRRQYRPTPASQRNGPAQPQHRTDSQWNGPTQPQHRIDRQRNGPVQPQRRTDNQWNGPTQQHHRIDTTYDTEPQEDGEGWQTVTRRRGPQRGGGGRVRGRPEFRGQ